MGLYGSVGSLVEMRGCVLDIKPNCNRDSVDRFLNQAIRMVCMRHTWSDLLKFVQVTIPNQTATGTVSTVTGSNIINGSGTGWPVSDAVNTTCANPVRQPGMTFCTPASMTNIIPGSWLLLDGGNAPQEAVAVTDVTTGGFYAACAQTHTAGFPITMSSLVNQQFRTAYNFLTVVAVVTPSQLLLDNPFPDITQTGAAYQILLFYCQPHPQAWRLKSVWDPQQGIWIDPDNFSLDQILAGDPQLTASDNPTIMAPAPPTAAGVPRWCIYPPQASGWYLPVIVSTTWPRLVADQDRAPGFIHPDVFILKAQSMALRTKTVTMNMLRDPYYDPQQAAEFERMFKEEMEVAEQADEARLAHRLQSYKNMPSGALSATYLLSHAGWPTDAQG
jgi:hypothetical protein